MGYLRSAWEDIREGRPHELTGRKVYICIDEITGVAAREALTSKMTDLVARVGSEGRKADWTIWIGGQQGTKAATGGGQAKASLGSLVAMRADRPEAARWLDVTSAKLPDHMKHLNPGECFMNSRSGLVHAQVPWLPDETIEEIVEVLDSRAGAGNARVIRPEALTEPRKELR